MSLVLQEFGRKLLYISKEYCSFTTCWREIEKEVGKQMYVVLSSSVAAVAEPAAACLQ